MTTRTGGVSPPPYASLNPASHVGDDPAAVAENRRILRAALPAEPLWLNQVHGAGVAQFPAAGTPDADAAVAHRPGQVCAVLTADCLPVLFCDVSGQAVAAAHAGWRGLAAGVLERTVEALGVQPGKVLAWLGAAIGPAAFEVGPEVRQAFVAQHAEAARAFAPGAGDRLLADIYELARIRLAAIGVTQVYGGGLCTHADASRFYSYRREGVTGRMASLVWLTPPNPDTPTETP
ncbi:MAG: peptidoglycan editing factor PgeF [Betaproteobacteria bacterium]|nr:peptidoglycan editing factor PgeF [Betaproteobacteria bacterium]